MEKQILNFTVNEQVLNCENPIRISTNKVNYIQANFDLGTNWSGFDSVRAVWFNDFNCISTVLDSLGNCVVPFEVMKRKGNVKVNLVGSISEDDVLTDRLTSYPVVAVIVDCTAQITGANTSPITPSEYEQFVAVVHEDAERAEAGATASEQSATESANSASASAESAQNASNSAESAHDDKIAIEEAIAEVIQQIEDFEQVQVVVNTLPPSSQATSDFIDGVLTLGIPQGVKGDTGNGIQSITKTGTSGLVDTYTITYTDGQTTTFTVTNGAKGDTGNGIASIEKTSTVGLVDTYTITYTNGTTTTFTVTNGEKGDKGDTGEVSQAELDEAVTDLKSAKADKQIGKNLLTTNRTLGSLTGAGSPTSQKPFKENEYYVGVSADGYVNTAKVTSYAVSDNSVSVQSNSGYGMAFPIKCSPSTKYAVSFLATLEASLINITVGFYNSNGVNVGYATSLANGSTFTTHASAYWMVICFGTPAAATEPCVFTNIQIELGTVATSYVPFVLNDGVAIYQGIDKVGALLGVNDNGNVEAVEGLATTIEQLAEIEQTSTRFFMGNYKIGGFYNGKYYGVNDYPNRVANVTFLKTAKDIVITASGGIQFCACFYNAETESSYYELQGWQSSLFVPANKIFRITMHKSPEQAIADINEYKNAITWEVYDAETANTIISRNKDILTNAQASCWYGLSDGGVLNAKKKLSILATTDAHGFAQGMESAILYENEMPFIDMGVCLGDMTPSYYSDSDGTWYTNIVNNSDKPFYTILGNHDGGNGKASARNATVAQSFAKWIQPTLETMEKEGLTTPYYYVENATHKIAMAFLNSYDVPDTTDGSGNFVVSRGAEVISQTQIDWLLGVLDSVPSDYTLVVFAHSFPYANNGYSCNWTQLGANVVGNTSACYTDVIPDIINAWKNGEALSKTYSPQLSDVSASVSINHSFTSRGQGKFACHIVGHGHRDVVAHSATYSDQLVVALCATANDTWQNGTADLPRVMGTKSEDAITLISIIPNYKRVNLVRIGSNTSVLMADRTMISLQYD